MHDLLPPRAPAGTHPMLVRLETECGYPRLRSPQDLAAFTQAPGAHCLFIPGDPRRNLETLDAAVILPELVIALRRAFDCALVDDALEAPLREETRALKTPRPAVFPRRPLPWRDREGARLVRRPRPHHLSARSPPVTQFTLPPTGFAPARDPARAGDLQCMPMPSGMRTYAPHIPEAGEGMAEALALLAEIAAACAVASRGGPAGAFDLAALTPSARRILADALGNGEVVTKLRGVPAILVQENVFAGVWMLAAATAPTAPALDRVEVGPLPHLPWPAPIGPIAPPSASRPPGVRAWPTAPRSWPS